LAGTAANTRDNQAAHPVPMKIATYNVNSIRRRLPIVLDWLAAHKPDVMCLQETKIQDQDFPVDAIHDAGYHASFRGMKAYNGVATLTRTPPEKVVHGLHEGPTTKISGSSRPSSAGFRSSTLTFRRVIRFLRRNTL
jgi:exodeoxyribonuclease III